MRSKNNIKKKYMKKKLRKKEIFKGVGFILKTWVLM